MSQNFAELINATTNARQRLKLLAVSHFLEGKSRTDIATFLKVSRRSVNIWIKAYLHSGLTGLEVKPRSGRPHRLTPEQLANIKQYVIDNAIKSEGGRLQGKDIKEYIETTFGVTYQKTNIYHLLNKLNLSWIQLALSTPNNQKKSKHLLKKFQINTILKIPGHVHLKDVHIWFQDEARFGQRNTTTRIWAKKGTSQGPFSSNNLSMLIYLARSVSIQVKPRH